MRRACMATALVTALVIGYGLSLVPAVASSSAVNNTIFSPAPQPTTISPSSG